MIIQDLISYVNIGIGQLHHYRAYSRLIIGTIHLFLEKLMSHGQEGDGEPAAEEQNEVCGQLVSGKHE